MKLFDTKGKLIGSISDEDYKKTEDSIMPVSVQISTPKRVFPSIGFYLMAFASLLAGASMLITGTLDKGVHYFESEETFKYGVFYDPYLGFIPVIVLLQLAATLILFHESNWFPLIMLVRGILLLVSYCLYDRALSDVDTTAVFVFAGVLDVFATTLTLAAFRAHAWKKGKIGFALIFCYGIFRLLTLGRVYDMIWDGVQQIKDEFYVSYFAVYFAEFIYLLIMARAIGKGVKDESIR